VPRTNTATVTRPDSDTAVKLASLAIGSAVAYMRARQVDVEDLAGSMATRSNVVNSLMSRDPALFIGVGHGSASVFTGQNQEVIFYKCNCRELSGRVTFLLGCLTGRELGPDIVDKGGRCYIGYKEEFTWVQEREVNPLEDGLGRAFFEPVLEICKRLADGETAGSAYRASIDKWNYWIDYWSRQADPAAAVVVMMLKWDRDAQVLYGDENAVAAQPVQPAVTVTWMATAVAMALTPLIIPLSTSIYEEASKSGVKM
jgi:hypothetical protein